METEMGTETEIEAEAEVISESETETDAETEAVPETEIDEGLGGAGDIIPELESLRAQLAEKEQKLSELEGRLAAVGGDLTGKLLSEVSELVSLFPDVSKRGIPDSVRESVKSGVPLAAAYAIYDKKREADEARERELIARIAGCNPGTLCGGGGGEGFFTREEVKAMSQKEVRKNYDKILASMPHW